jgi:hypothetical protein
MDKVKTIDELLKEKNISPAEEEQLRDIIEECRVREIQIKQSAEAAKQNLEDLGKTFGMIAEAIGSVGQSVSELHKEIEELQLKLMPDDQFFRE